MGNRHRIQKTRFPWGVSAGRFVALLLALIVSAVVNAQDPALRSGNDDSVIVLQSDRPDAFAHRIVDGRYRVEVRYSASVLGVLERTVKFQSLESGEVANVEFYSGAFIKPDEKLAKPRLDRPGEFAVEKPRFDQEYRFPLKWNLDPNQAERDYQKAMTDNRKEAEKTKDLPSDAVARERAVNKRVRELCVATIKSIKPVGANRRAVRMGPATFYEEPGDPIAALRDVYRWWQFDKLLSEVDERPDDGWADAKKLAFGQEIMDLLSGAITEDQTKLLTAAQRRKLIQGCEFRIAFDFEPAPTEKRPDERWRQAFRVRFGDDGPTAAVWSTSVGGTGAPGSDWLDLGPAAKSARPQLAIRGEPGSVATMWVTGPDDGLFLRVIPRTGKSAAAVRLELSAGPGDRSIEIPERSRAAAKFPF